MLLCFGSKNYTAHLSKKFIYKTILVKSLLAVLLFQAEKKLREVWVTNDSKALYAVSWIL